MICSAGHGRIEVRKMDLPLLNEIMSAPLEGVPLQLSLLEASDCKFSTELAEFVRGVLRARLEHGL